MQTTFKRHHTYNPPSWCNRLSGIYDDGFVAAMLGKADDNPYKIPQHKACVRTDENHMYWQAGYDEYEGE